VEPPRTHLHAQFHVGNGPQASTCPIIRRHQPRSQSPNTKNKSHLDLILCQ
jgi:hypothetical protein